MKFLRLIGDCHGNPAVNDKMERLVALASEAEHSICLGDIGFNYATLNAISPDRLKCLAGNHDNYEQYEGRFIKQTDHFLGDFGTYQVPDGPSFFFVRGGFSIDWRGRAEGRNLFQHHEELSHKQGLQAIDMYKDVKPDYVISHECPTSVIDLVSARKYWDGELIRPSNTARLLEAMFYIHEPRAWWFGHHHRDYTTIVRSTQFQCLAELSCVDFNKGDL